MPDKPRDVEVSDVTKTSGVVTWQAPAQDGGTPITGYYLERCTKSSERWVRQNKDLISETSYNSDNLMEETTYMFRVVAVNKRGESLASDASTPVTAKDPFGQYYILSHFKNLLNNCYRYTFYLK